MHEGSDESETLRRFEETLDLVEIVARQVGRVIGGAVELDDLRSFGREGLLDAARRYDPSRGVPFRGYANYRVRGAIFDGVRKMSRLPRRVHERLAGLSALALMMSPCAAQQEAPAQVKSSIVYKTVNGTEILADVYLPEKSEKPWKNT